MNTCPNCGKMAGLHSSILQGCMCQYSMQAPPQQEPVAWMDADGNVSDNNDHKCFPIPLYTTPPQRTWVGLTDDEYAELAEEFGPFPINQIEAKLKEKNT